MSLSVHNPDQYMVSLRQIIAQGRKRIGFLIGAGAPAGIKVGGAPLIPAVAGLTDQVLAVLPAQYAAPVGEVVKTLVDPNIETILTRVRGLAGMIGTTPVCGLDGDGHKALADAICAEIGKIVDRSLPPGPNPYTDIVNWISGTDREHPVEIFTTNYDLLLEQALERNKVPYFDGFTGSNEPFFDPSTVLGGGLPSRWVRLWKLHGSLGWKANAQGEVIRGGGPTATHLVFPEFLKYEQTQKAPYSALFERLHDFLLTPDSLLIVVGFSFADAHVSGLLEECLAANASGSIFAFQFKNLSGEGFASKIAGRHANMSLYARDQALVNGIAAKWQPGDPPTKDWGPIRATYWEHPATGDPYFSLGSFEKLARFFAAARAPQTYATVVATAAQV
jgi:hypothetical protein